MVRFVVLSAALALFVPLSAVAQDACTADFGTHIGSPACPYQWVGATTVLYDGSGNGLGFIGMTSQCRADFGPGARMCTSQEILDSDTNNFNAIPDEGCWIKPVFQPVAVSSSGFYALDASGTIARADDFTCSAWGVPSFGSDGLTLTSAGRFNDGSCDIPRSVACCKPTPVPVPTSSLTLPIGMGALAGLSILKGGA